MAASAHLNPVSGDGVHRHYRQGSENDFHGLRCRETSESSPVTWAAPIRWRILGMRK